MKKLSLYREKLNHLENLKKEVEKLENSNALKSDINFVKDIEKVLKKHGRKVADLADAFPELKFDGKNTSRSSTASTTKKKSTTRKRSQTPLRTFKHPHSGETVQARRTNNKTLQNWAEELGVKPEELEVK